MSGAKETPRQKMIGMMYLVYTALLAMNVSADILDAFALVNDGQEKTNASIEVKINEQYMAFEDQYNKEQAKTQIYWEQAQEIREKTDEIINYIEKEVKVPLVLAVEGLKSEAELLTPKDPEKPILRNVDKADPSNRRVFYDLELTNIGKKDDYDTPTTIMVENDKKATELKHKIQEYREYIVNAMESMGLKDYNHKVGLLTDTDPDGKEIVYINAANEQVDWEHKNFSHVVFVAEIAILNKIVGEIQTTEYDAVGALMDRIGATDYKFNKLQARVIAKSNYITQGQDYEAEVFLVASDTMRNFDAKYAMGVDNFHKYTGTPTVVKSDGGIVKLKLPGKTVGQQKYAGVIELISPETGEKEYHPFNASYMVAAPSATVAPTKMMILYEELQNPILASAPGYASKDLIVTAKGGKVTEDKKSGEGHYFVEVNKGVREVEVTVSTKIDNKIVDLGKHPFRVKRVPDPVINIGGYIKDGEKVEKEQLAIAGFLKADLKDFDFQGYEYSIESYTVLTIRNNIIKKDNVGANFSNEVKELISNTKAGQMIIFNNIVVRTPKGEKRQVDSSITVTIK